MTNTPFETELAAFFNKKFCVFTGNGTTALHLAYESLSHGKKKIVFPATFCPAPVFASIEAGYTPLFSDVNESDGCMDPASLDKLLASEKEAGLVVAAHMFGHGADLEAIQKICRERGAVLIEDAAQAIGGARADGVLFGSGGDGSVISFGHTKIIDAGAGGAFLTDNAQAAETAEKTLQTLPKTGPSRNTADLYRRLYYAIWEARKLEEKSLAMFDQFPPLFGARLLHQAEEKDFAACRSGFKTLSSEIAHRKAVAKIYQNELGDVPGIKLFQPKGDVVPWRFSFRVSKDIRDGLLLKIREGQRHASSWYPNAAQLWTGSREKFKGTLPNAEKIEKEIVNLWVDQFTQEKDALETARLIKDFLSEK